MYKFVSVTPVQSSEVFRLAKAGSFSYENGIHTFTAANKVVKVRAPKSIQLPVKVRRSLKRFEFKKESGGWVQIHAITLLEAISRLQ